MSLSSSLCCQARKARRFAASRSWMVPRWAPVMAAYKAAEAGTLDGVLVSFDECGPISLKPHAGSGWFTVAWIHRSIVLRDTVTWAPVRPDMVAAGQGAHQRPPLSLGQRHVGRLADQ